MKQISKIRYPRNKHSSFIQNAPVNWIINFLIRYYCIASIHRGIDTKAIWKESFGFWWILSRFDDTITNTFVGKTAMHSHISTLLRTNTSRRHKHHRLWERKGKWLGKLSLWITKRIVKSSSLFPSSYIPWNT